MKYYKKIDIDFYDDIVSDTLSYLKEQKPEIYNREINATYYVLDLVDFKKYCPKLDAGFARYGLVCNFAVAYVMYKNSDTSIHVDGYPYGNARINLPILNVNGTFTRFYSGGEFIRVVNPITKVGAFKLTGIKDLRFLDKVEIDKPTVLLVNEPHDVIMDIRNPPRITLSLGFDKDPIFLLD